MQRQRAARRHPARTAAGRGAGRAAAAPSSAPGRRRRPLEIHRRLRRRLLHDARRSLADGGRRHGRAGGRLPGAFFTSRKWTFEHGNLIVRNHKAEPLAQLSYAGGHFEGHETGGAAVTLSR